MKSNNGTLNRLAGLCPARLKKVLMPERHHFALQKPTFFSAAAILTTDFEIMRGGRGSRSKRP